MYFLLSSLLQILNWFISDIHLSQMTSGQRIVFHKGSLVSRVSIKAEKSGVKFQPLIHPLTRRNYEYRGWKSNFGDERCKIPLVATPIWPKSWGEISTPNSHKFWISGVKIIFFGVINTMDRLDCMMHCFIIAWVLYKVGLFHRLCYILGYFILSA